MYSLRAQDLLQQQPESHRRHNMGYLVREHRHVSLLPPDFSKTLHPPTWLSASPLSPISALSPISQPTR